MSDAKKKEKVLHTRITPNLEKKIRKEANSLGISVSNLVRNILGNTFDLVEDIVADSTQITRPARRRAGLSNAGEQLAADADPVPISGQARVLGWQEAILNLNAVCDHCNDILNKGSRAAIGIVEGNGPRPTICLTCLQAFTHDNEKRPDNNA